MTLSSGSRLGPYEILAPLGAGGMGEVYRAKDPRLGREVAIKVLPASFSNDQDRLRRFELEARAAGILNHPNITAVYDIGTHDGAPYVVTELLEGETLRGRLSGGAVPVRKAIDWALQIVHGLAAAHEKGIVHRDLKPENLFVTKDGRTKILDFGLAKLTQAEEAGPQTNMPTAAAATEPGVVLGTLGYMSPEQVKGRGADARSDIFAFGAILYEMLSGKRAFHRDSAAETMSAILKEEPPDLSATNQNIQPGLERIVRHCLEKNPEERFHSAHDLAFDLEALSSASSPRAVVTAAGEARKKRLLLPLAAALGLATALAAGYLVGNRKAATPPPAFHQLTFRRGPIWSARFAPDGKTVVYSAAWDGKPTEVFLNSPESPESRPLALPGADVLAVSASGEIAVSLGSQLIAAYTKAGTLARASVTGGGAPREVLENVEFADWSPDGRELAVVRTVAGRTRLELPIGKVLYDTSGWIGHPRVSPRGDRIAFIDHLVQGDDGGSVSLVDRAGKKTSLSGRFASIRGLAWSPSGSEVWFTAAEVGSNRAMYGVTLSGKQRVVARVPGCVTIHDISRDGRVLLSHDAETVGFLASASGEGKERDLSWLDYGNPNDISLDGKTVIFSESGEGGGQGYSVYLRKTDGSPAVRLGEGAGASLSPDGKWAASIFHNTTDAQVILYPTGAGEPRLLSSEGLKVRGVRWLPDGRRLLFGGVEEGHGLRMFVRDVEGGKPRAVTPEKYGGLSGISPDGKRFIVRAPDRRFVVYPLEGGEPTPIPGLAPDDSIAGWTADERFVYVRRGGQSFPARIDRLDITTGHAEKWKDLAPADMTGLISVRTPRIAPDGRSYTYSAARVLSALFLVDGVK
jgi:Tol biopolymer transport system component